MGFRVGFILGKEFDLIDAPGSVVDTAFTDDLPKEYRQRPPQPRMVWPGMKDDNSHHISVDLAIVWYIKKQYADIDVDFIFPGDISLDRLKSNLCNFIIGYDILDAMCEGEDQLAKVTHAFKTCGNIMPSWEVQEEIYMKSKYMNKCMEGGVEVAPTIFSLKETRSTSGLLTEIEARGWSTFLLKQSYSCGSIGLAKLSLADCKANPRILEEYFEKYAECPEYIVQEFIPGFSRNWEVRCFWFNNEFLYAIANRAAFSTAEGENVGIISGDDIPQDFLEQAKAIGKQALKTLPQLTTPGGHSIGMTCIRTDIGCADSPVQDKAYAHWNLRDRNFFLNEVEYGATTYFARSLKFDSIPMWAKLYADKAREIHKKMVDDDLIKDHGYLVEYSAVCPTSDSLDSPGEFSDKEDTSSHSSSD